MLANHPTRRISLAGLGATLLGATLLGTALLGIPAPASAAPPDLIGEIRHYTITKEDTLVDLARQYNLGYTELRAANPGVDPWIPGEGTEIILPTAHLLPDGPREGLVLNLVDQRIYYFPANGGPVESYPIGTGRAAWDTPTGSTEIIRKKRRPSWYVPKSIREEDPELPKVAGPGPNNPLGLFAMYLGWPSYLIHGTNNPWGVGRRVSHGCIRLYPEDISVLFQRVPVNTRVTVLSQEVKIGRVNGALMVEIHPNPEQADEIEEKGAFTPANISELAYRIVTAAGKESDRIDWANVRRAASERRGVPVRVLKPKTRIEAAASYN